MLCRLFPEGPVVRVLLVGTVKVKPRLGPIKPKNGSVDETGIYLRNV